MATYIRTTQGKDEYSSCKSIKLIYDHPDLTKGQWVSNPSAELIAAEDWVEFVPPTPEPQPQTEPTEYEKVSALNILNADKIVALDDESALVVKALFTPWSKMIGQFVEAGLRLYYDNRLWKVLQGHTAQEEWTPDATPALFTEITLEDGTIEHPIHYNNNMELTEGLYYTQDEDKYYCFRSTGVPVYNPLSELVGLYVNVVNS